jgi:TrmH family RNA methyltransferase
MPDMGQPSTRDPFTERTPRIVAAGKLRKRAQRERAGRFLAEGAQAVREALAWAASGGVVHELFVTETAAAHDPELPAAADRLGIPVSAVTDRAAAGLSETVTPQGVVALCDLIDQPLDRVVENWRPALVVVLAGVTDPGNAGTVIRVADAAGADAVLLAGESVDPHNGKCVRASTGSIFHLPIAKVADPAEALAACRGAGLRTIAADGSATEDIDRRRDALAEPAAWVFGSEAHGLPKDIVDGADEVLRVPIHGAAESLNLATAAAVCLYASASAQRAVR